MAHVTTPQLKVPRSLYNHSREPSVVDGVIGEANYSDSVVEAHAELSILVRDILRGEAENDVQFQSALAGHYDRPLNSHWVIPEKVPEDLPEGVSVALRIQSPSARKSGFTGHVSPSSIAWEKRPSLLVAKASFPSVNGTEMFTLDYRPENTRIMAIMGVPVLFGENGERQAHGVTTELLPSEGGQRRALGVNSPYFQAIKGTLQHILAKG